MSQTGKNPQLFSVDEPAPSLEQYLYSSFRGSVKYLNLLGIPILIFFMIYYTVTFGGEWSDALYRMPAVIGSIAIGLILFIKEYRSYISWLIITLGFNNYASITYHALVVVESAQAMNHVMGGVIIFVVAIMAVAPMLSTPQLILCVFGGAFIPDLMVLATGQTEYIEAAVRIRLLISAVFVILLCFKVRNDNVQAYLLQLRLHQASQNDSMSKLYNRTGLFANLNAEIQRLQREKSSLGLMLIDIDFFKKINDEFGHPVGDRVIQTLAAVFSDVVRPYDLVGRVGGEEFLIAVVGIDRVTLKETAEKIRKRVSMELIHEHGRKISATVSIGLNLIQFSDKPIKLSVEIKKADEAMFRAKKAGRNRVEF